jgi:uncharacterized protein
VGIRRILSLDGGGIKGVFLVAFLAAIETRVGRPIAAHSDLIAGTSTGGIAALGLGLGFTAQDVLVLYEKFGREVFGGNRLLQIVRHAVSAKYSPEPLRRVLADAFGDRTLGDSRCRLVIPSLNLETGRVHVYKTAHHPRFEMDYTESAMHVAMATAAAPTYFPLHRSGSGLPLVDGGLWANNPVGMAVVEAIGVLQWDRADLRVLSLGCPTPPVDTGAARWKGKGWAYWAARVPDLFISGQSFASLGTAKLLAGHDNVYRVCLRGDFGWTRRGRSIPSRGWASLEAREAIPTLKEVFFKEPAERFEPYHREPKPEGPLSRTASRLRPDPIAQGSIRGPDRPGGEPQALGHGTVPRDATSDFPEQPQPGRMLVRLPGATMAVTDGGRYGGGFRRSAAAFCSTRPAPRHAPRSSP